MFNSGLSVFLIIKELLLLFIPAAVLFSVVVRIWSGVTLGECAEGNCLHSRSSTITNVHHHREHFTREWD